MSIFDALLLGLLQGLTEFLPVSSSGHLVLAQALLGVKQPGVSFEVILHLGTLFSVLIFFRARILLLIRSLYTPTLTRERQTVLLLILGSVPAGLVGVTLNDFFERAFSSPLLAATMLIVTALILLSTRLVRNGKDAVNWKTAIVIGIGQSLAIMPGISRSGTTIAAGILSKIDPMEAAEFSFLLAIPAIGGAAMLKSSELMHLPSALLWPYVIGALVSFLSGLLAVYLVMGAVKRGRFDYFAYYCFAAGAVGIYLYL
ncbi:MAG: undecaprenyl-diphosphate phosphatase [Candidatus Zixiibacteriota bacterium]|nr:MAG: undecaprenyl-diphosphate phosphatase [candidate division Zixibacteria bacterium]